MAQCDDTCPAYRGNLELLDRPKTAFLASRGILPEDVLRCLDWAAAQRDAGRCIIGGFHAPLEKDVLRVLLKGRQPIVIVLARRHYRRIPEALAPAMQTGRLLLVSVSAAARADAHTTRLRNQYIVDHCDQVVIGALDPGGHLADLVASLPKSRRISLHHAHGDR